MPEHLVRGDARVADFLAEATAFPTPEHVAEHVVVRIKPILNVELAVWDRYSHDWQPVAFRLSDDVPGLPGLYLAFKQHFREHPFARDLGPVLLARGMFTLSDRISNRQLRQTGLWNEVYIHLRARHQIGMGGRIDANSNWGISVNRLGRDFTTRERELARQIQQGLDTAFQGVARREMLQRLGVLVATASNEAAASLTLSAEGHVRHVSPAAEELLRSRLGRDAAVARPGFADIAALVQQIRLRAGAVSVFTFRMIDGMQTLIVQAAAGDDIVLLLEVPGAAGPQPARLSRRWPLPD